MTDWIIERGVPIPDFRRDKDRIKRLRQAFSEMKTGESLFTRTIDARSVTNAYMKISWDGPSFVSRTMDGGVRVWRMK